MQSVAAQRQAQPGASHRRGARASGASGAVSCRPGAPCRRDQQQQPALGPCRAAYNSNEPGTSSSSWGDARPDTCWDDQDRAAPGPLSDLDAEWQAFIAGSSRCQQPPPLIWNGDGHSGGWQQGSSGGPSASGRRGDGGVGGGESGLLSTSNRGPEASTSGGSSSSSSKRYSSSIQSFDDWDTPEVEDFALPVPANEALHKGGAAAAAAASSSSSAGASAAATASLADALWSAAVAPHAPARDSALSPADLLSGRGLWHSLREVYVLLFGVGSKDTEGIYSLRAVSEDGLPTETIIAFESMDDAARYAGLLEATMDHSPHVCSIPPAELMAFCSDSGYRCRLELEGSLLMPPDYNVHVTDWERSLRLREGKFHVLPEEPEYSPAGAAGGAGAGAAAAAAGSGSYSQLLLRHYSEYSQAQLDTLKAQLEALLPATPSFDDGDSAGGRAAP